MRLIPAPRGTGIVSAPVPKKLLQMAGIEDCYTSASGQTATLGNLVGRRQDMEDMDFREKLLFDLKKHVLIYIEHTVEPRYKEVGYNKPSYNKVILLVPALYIYIFFPLI